MSFFNKLADLGKKLMQDAETALGRVTSKGTLTRVVQASYLIAAADGHVDDSEKIVLGKVIQRKLPQFKASEVAKELEQATEVCALSMVAGKVELMENIQKSAGSDDAKIIMLAVLAVANADGEFSDSEKIVARNICRNLCLPTSEYGL